MADEKSVLWDTLSTIVRPARTDMTTHVSELPRLWSVRQTLAVAISTANGDPYQSRDVVGTEMQDARTNCATPSPPPLLAGGRAGPPPPAIGGPTARALQRQTKACGLPVGCKSKRADPLCCGWMHHMSILDARITQFSSQGGIDISSAGVVAKAKRYACVRSAGHDVQRPIEAAYPTKNAVVLHQRMEHHIRRSRRRKCGRRAVRVQPGTRHPQCHQPRG